MAEFLEDPSILTKDKLKSELQANDVPLPNGEHKKDVYVQLYLKHLTVLNKKKIPSPDTFSSDEEIMPVISNRSRSGKKATKKTDKNRKEDVDVASLTNSDLKDQLLKFGINPGPIVASTRKLYEKRLQKLLDQPPETMPPEPETAVPETVTLKAGGSQNGNTHSTEDQYSDKEEDVLGADPEPVPVSAKPVRSHGKTAVTTRTSSRYRSKQVEETTVTDNQAESEERSDLLKEMFPNEVSTPTGMIASCRRPIRGAAGRPVRPLDLWSEESLLKQRVFTSTKSEVTHSYSSPPPAPRPARRSFSIWIKLLVFLTLVATLYYVLQNVSSEQIDSCMLYLQDNVVTPILTAIGVLGQEKSAGSK